MSDESFELVEPTVDEGQPKTSKKKQGSSAR